MLPTSESGQAADVVARLLPPLPGFLHAAAGRQSFSHPPTSSSSSSSGNCSSQQQQQPSFWKQHERLGHDRQQAISSNNTSSRRRVPTADGSPAGPSSPSSSHTGRAPIDIVLRGTAAGGIGAGAGGMCCGPSNAFQLRLWPLPGFSRSSASSKSQKTILIMMSNTGGGHKASAEALKQAIEEKYGNKYRVLVVDMWAEHTPYPFSELPNSYSFLVQHGFLWRFTYHLLQPRMVHMPYMSGIHAFTASHLHKAFDMYDPDLVVSVHPLMQHIPARVLAARAKRLGRAAPVPLATVVTDFTTCHNTWFYRKVNKCFVPTEFCRQLGLGMGLTPEQLVLYGLPIRPIFSKRLPSKGALRKKLGLLQDAPAILLVGGGEGMGKLQATVQQLDLKLQGKAQVAVICGRNKKLLAELQRTQWPGGSHVVACGFVDNIHEWMAAVDTIITKAGPGTIAEALISGLPILLNGNVPCQEEGNIPYVLDNGVGAFETDPVKIAGIMSAWLSEENKEEFRHMAHRSRALGRPHAVYDIAHDLAKLADELGSLAKQLVGAAGSGGSSKSCCGGKGTALPVGQLVAA